MITKCLFGEDPVKNSITHHPAPSLPGCTRALITITFLNSSPACSCFAVIVNRSQALPAKVLHNLTRRNMWFAGTFNALQILLQHSICIREIVCEKYCLHVEIHIRTKARNEIYAFL